MCGILLETVKCYDEVGIAAKRIPENSALAVSGYTCD